MRGGRCLSAMSFFIAIFGSIIFANGVARSQMETIAPESATGTVSALTGTNITVMLDHGASSTFLVPSTARILRLTPGNTDIKSAKTIALSGISAGDRVLIRTGSTQNGLPTASMVVVVKQGDVQQKYASDRNDWEKRGVVGVVRSVDPASGIVDISTEAAAGTFLQVQVSEQTKQLRYAANSGNFSNARPGLLTEIRVGDLLRARGDRSNDGTMIAAEEIISGPLTLPAQAQPRPDNLPQQSDNGIAQNAPQAQEQQDIADKIEELQSDMEEQQSEAENWDQQVSSLGDTSNCTGPSASICVSIAQIGARKAQANASKARRAAQQDQAEINRLQGEANELVQQGSNVNTSTSQQPQYDPNGIVNTGDQQATEIRAVGDANAAARKSNAGKPAASTPNSAGQQCLDQNRKPIPGSENWKACPGW